MSQSTIRTRVGKLEKQLQNRDGGIPVLSQIREDPSQIMTLAGLDADCWQEEILRSHAEQSLLLASRQAGKSQVAAALALKAALLQSNSLTLLLSPTQRQSGELFRDKVLRLYNALSRPVKTTQESALQMTLSNGSRIISLPGEEGTVRGYSSVSLLIIDEAARVSDALYYSVRPMLAVSQGRLVALSTPFGKRGWFHDEWAGEGTWERVKITADQCPRISEEFLKQEKRALGDRWYRQEYLCSFESTTDAVFAYEDIQAALSDDVQPLFPIREVNDG